MFHSNKPPSLQSRAWANSLGKRVPIRSHCPCAGDLQMRASQRQILPRHLPLWTRTSTTVRLPRTSDEKYYCNLNAAVSLAYCHIPQGGRGLVDRRRLRGNGGPSNQSGVQHASNLSWASELIRESWRVRFGCVSGGKTYSVSPD